MLWNRPDPVFGFLVHDISRLLRKRFDRRARGLGLTKSQWIVLAHLARHEGIHQGGLAEILELEPATLARHLDRLEDTGWIERRPNPSDRRAWRLHLTVKAAPVLERMGELVEVTTHEALAGLDAGERERLQAHLLTIRANLADRPEALAEASAPETAEPRTAARESRAESASELEPGAEAAGALEAEAGVPGMAAIAPEAETEEGERGAPRRRMVAGGK